MIQVGVYMLWNFLDLPSYLAQYFSRLYYQAHPKATKAVGKGWAVYFEEHSLSAVLKFGTNS